MEAIILGSGTSQGVPVIGCKCDVCKSRNPKDNRLRASLLLKINNTNILIDAGPDFRQQMLREKVESLDAIIFTHEHKDHIAGLDDVRAFNFSTKQPMEIFAERRVQTALRNDYSYVFSGSNYPGIPRLNLNTIDEEAFFIKDIKITPIRAMHYNLPILGFRIGNLTYITDANYISEEEKLKIIGSKTLIINALRKEKHIAHFSLDEALKIVNECSPRKAYFTHIAHQMGLHNEINTLLPDFTELAHDGLSIKFDI
ncbi:MAG: MBL fold metallo-hydrolase [Bacteroidales bacterium]|nr:MBL fold metallo-hydrolase [Bacteroidales bacterium]MDD4217476.1 MBL fold metallo-hydrolase [Bacteroidales bacterium]MDY0142578.1 MBL fold metallo-hydrolase [Bacteroidales bacterium]